MYAWAVGRPPCRRSPPFWGTGYLFTKTGTVVIFWNVRLLAHFVEHQLIRLYLVVVNWPMLILLKRRQPSSMINVHTNKGCTDPIIANPINNQHRKVYGTIQQNLLLYDIHLNNTMWHNNRTYLPFTLSYISSEALAVTCHSSATECHWLLEITYCRHSLSWHPLFTLWHPTSLAITRYIYIPLSDLCKGCLNV